MFVVPTPVYICKPVVINRTLQPKQCKFTMIQCNQDNICKLEFPLEIIDKDQAPPLQPDAVERPPHQE